MRTKAQLEQLLFQAGEAIAETLEDEVMAGVVTSEEVNAWLTRGLSDMFKNIQAVQRGVTGT
jgi:hypothetical protein